MNKLKQRIIQNSFVDSIRHMSVDRVAFREFCDAVVQLTAEWRTARTIDKEIVSALYTAVRVTEHAAEGMKQYEDARASDVAEMAHELDGLLHECFGTVVPPK